MPTRKELIDQARADQRARSARTRADSPKSAIVGIGDRDPKTGLFAVKTGDGVDGVGEKQFNSSLPNGSQVLGIPQSGGWLLDERDIQPIAPPLQPSPMGKVKILFSVIKGNDRVFYLWGDRPKPKRVGTMPLLNFVIYAPYSTENYLVSAAIDNRGNGNKYTVGLQWSPNYQFSENLGSVHTQVIGDQNWSNENAIEIGSLPYIGHGFWSGYDRGIFSQSNGFDPYIVRLPSTTIVYRGNLQKIVGDIQYTVGEYQSDLPGAPPQPNFITSQITTVPIQVLPELTRIDSYFQTRTYPDASTDFTRPGQGNDSTTYFPIVVSQNMKQSIYGYSRRVRAYNQANINLSERRLVTIGSEGSEVVLGGEMLPSDFDYGLHGFSNLINSRLFLVKQPTDLSQPQWDVDIYNLGTNTTKSTIKAKVTYKHKTGMTFHSASYHP